MAQSTRFSFRLQEGTTTCQPEKAAEPATAVPTNESGTQNPFK